MTKKTEKVARMVGIGAAVGMVGAAAAAMTVGMSHHKKGSGQKLMKDARQMGQQMNHMMNDVVSMFRG